MSTISTEQHSTRDGWATGLAVFAGTMLATVGLFQFFEGLSAVLKDQVYVTTRDYIFQFDLTAWGWIHLVLGALNVLVGVMILSNRLAALMVGIGLAALSALTNFMFLPWYPVWALVIIALDVAVIWALSVQMARTVDQ